MSPAHPAVIMADNPIKLYNEAGEYQGRAKPNPTYKASFHEWGVDPTDTSIEAPTDSTYNVSKGRRSKGAPTS